MTRRPRIALRRVDGAAGSKAHRQSQLTALDGDDDLTDASNAVVDLADAGHLDEAEAAALPVGSRPEMR